MSNLSYVKSQLVKDEKIICVGKIHWQIFLLPIILTLLFLPAIIEGLQNTNTKGAAPLLITILLMIWIIKLIQKKTTELALTNRRVIAKFGFIRRQTYEINLSKIEGINFKQTIFNRLLGCGSIIVKGVGGDSSPIRFIANYQQFKKECQELVGNKENVEPLKNDSTNVNIKCPMCAEYVKPEAKKCKHCGEFLTA